MIITEKKQAQAEQEEDYKALVAENEREMEEMKLAYEEKLRAAREEGGEVNRAYRHLEGISKGDSFHFRVIF